MSSPNSHNGLRLNHVPLDAGSVGASRRRMHSAKSAWQDMIGGMDDSRRQNALALARLQQWVAYVIIFAALVVWVVVQPPPDHWLPIVVLLLAIAAVVTRAVSSLRNDGTDDKPAENRP